LGDTGAGSEIVYFAGISAPSANAASGTTALFGTTWTIAEIAGKPVAVDPNQRKIVLAFDDSRRVYSGISGCTDLVGRFASFCVTYTATSDKSAPTCRVDEQTDRAIRNALQDTRGHRAVSTTALELLDSKGKCIARLER